MCQKEQAISWKSIVRTCLYFSVVSVLLSGCIELKVKPEEPSMGSGEYCEIPEATLIEQEEAIKKPIVVEKPISTQKKEGKKFLSSTFSDLEQYKKKRRKEWSKWSKKNKTRKKARVYKRERIKSLRKKRSIDPHMGKMDLNATSGEYISKFY